MHETLQFVHSDRPPAHEVEVFDARTCDFLGATFTFRVVGSSHYVSAPAYDFYELSSCEPVPTDRATAISLDSSDAVDPGAGPTRLVFETDALACETAVEQRPLDAFPRDRSFDLSYRFDPEAYTTIDLGSRGYETYHTYPEFDLALYTHTRFTRIADREFEASVTSPPASRSSTD